MPRNPRPGTSCGDSFAIFALGLILEQISINNFNRNEAKVRLVFVQETSSGAVFSSTLIWRRLRLSVLASIVVCRCEQGGVPFSYTDRLS